MVKIALFAKIFFLLHAVEQVVRVGCSIRFLWCVVNYLGAIAVNYRLGSFFLSLYCHTVKFKKAAEKHSPRLNLTNQTMLKPTRDH